MITRGLCNKSLILRDMTVVLNIIMERDYSGPIEYFNTQLMHEFQCIRNQIPWHLQTNCALSNFTFQSWNYTMNFNQLVSRCFLVDLCSQFAQVLFITVTNNYDNRKCPWKLFRAMSTEIDATKRDALSVLKCFIHSLKKKV